MRRIPQTVAVSAASLALLLAAGCGSDDSVATAGGLDSVTIAGEFGEAPEVTWDGELLPRELETEVLIEGDGEVPEAGTEVMADLWIGNGYTQEQAFSTFDEGGSPEMLRVGELTPGFDAAIDGQAVGSRVAVAAPPDDAFGEGGNPSLGIGNGDGVLFVVDIIGLVPAAPEDVKPGQLPKVTENGKGEPNGFDFGRIDEPSADGPFLRATLKQGDGEVVRETDTVRVNYVGMTYEADKPFDRSFDQENPTEFPLDGVVAGWTRGLSGVKAGSRVVLQIPPMLGYGDREQENIPAGSTLFFVVDVVEIVDPAEAGQDPGSDIEIDPEMVDPETVDPEGTAPEESQE